MRVTSKKTIPLKLLLILTLSISALACEREEDLLEPDGLAGPPSYAAGEAEGNPYLYGIHDHDTNIQEFLDRTEAGGATAWVTATIAIGSDPGQHGGDDFSWIAERGHTVIVRLNNGYCGDGTIPVPEKYDDFAQRAANYVSATQGADIFVIGNETNLAVEWPPVNGHAAYVSPQDYAKVFRKTYDAIKAASPDAQVVSQALAPFAGPYSAGSTCGYSHDGNPLNWVQYLNEMLTEINSTGGIDGIALHINSRGYTFDDIHSTQKVNAGGQDLFFSFYVYKDWVDLGIPEQLYHLPLYATESNGVFYWSGGHPENPGSHYEQGWVQEVYAEIDRYNQEAATTDKPIYRAINLYRWCAWCDGWNINDSPYKGQILDDYDVALAAGYRWPAGPPDDTPELPAGDNVALGAVAWSASSSFNGDFGGDKAYDGVVSQASKWTSDGSTNESWLALDLGGDFDITGFVVEGAGAAGELTGFNIQNYLLQSGTSLSGPWTTLASVDNSRQDNTTITILAESETARYVRLYITDAGIDDYARVPEFEVYGAATPEPPPPADNVALGAVAWSASSSFSGDFGGDKAYDGVLSEASKWTSDGSSAESWLALDLGLLHDITSFVVQHAGAGGELTSYNTRGYRLESGTSLTGPWTTLATVDNSAQENSTTTTLAESETARFVRLYITDAGIDDYARIPEFEVYGTPAEDSGGNLVANGDFAAGLGGWSVWTERGSLGARVENGQLQMSSVDHNGGVYQQFNTGGAGAEISISGFWASDPTVANTQWAEVLIINGSRTPVDGEDVTEGQSDVILIKKNDTWATPAGWSGSMSETAPVANLTAFTATGSLAAIILKSGNMGGVMTGTRFDDILVESGSSPPPAGNQSPTAIATADVTTGDAPLSVTLDGSGSSDPDGDALSYSWDFGDGDASSGVSVTHTYLDAGTYIATLTVDDGRGATDDATLTISVESGQVDLPPFCPSAVDFSAIRESLNQQGSDLAFVKIGFHVGPGGNQDGLGEWMECMDAAGVPFFLKSADSGGQIFEAAQLKAASGVPHVLVYRKSVDSDNDWVPDVPDYNQSPFDAAVTHWQRHREDFPPELEPYKHLIWVETINEVDKNRAEWLGEFAYHTAQMAMDEGFNWAAFGWSSGEPERDHWEGPWMQQFLELAADNPERVAVALHEYSYVTDNLDRLYPFLVGRFQTLFDVADSFGIARPTVLITEFGWEYQDVPGVSQAMDVDLPWAAELYAEFPEVKGAAIWYLGPGFGGIANEAQRLIDPLTEYSLQNYFVIQ